MQLGELGVFAGLPGAGQLENGEEAIGVLLEVLGQFVHEQGRAEPVEAGAVVLGEKLVAGDRLLAKVVQRLAVREVEGVVGVIGFPVEEIGGGGSGVTVNIVFAGIKKGGGLGAEGQGLAGLDGVERAEE